MKHMLFAGLHDKIQKTSLLFFKINKIYKWWNFNKWRWNILCCLLDAWQLKKKKKITFIFQN
jgi:hypothetical protein